MGKRKWATIIIIGLVFINYIGFLQAVDDKDKYYPYPVIFIHGINSDSKTWATTIGYKSGEKSILEGKLALLFAKTRGGDEARYPAQVDVNNAVRFVDYGSDDPLIGKMGDAKKIAEHSTMGLLAEIKAIETHWNDKNVNLLQDKRGIIVVCHSYGGIILRYFLKQHPEYNKYIKKVVFIGVPHKGSPLASAMWIINNPKSQLIHGIRRNISANIEFQKSSTDHRGYACVF
jgi:triacylglycerol esterase/lipase EstA (alpha/beta hydrolase family)